MENQAPKEFEASEGLQVAIPLPDGSVELFEMWYSPVAETELLQKYPAIRSYKGISQADHSIMRMTVSPIGWKAMIKTKEGQILIDMMLPFILFYIELAETSSSAQYSKKRVLGVKTLVKNPNT